MKKNSLIELKFQKLGHFWLDSGLIGFIKILEKMDAEIQIQLNDNHLILKGTEKDIQTCLERSYNTLIKDYYNRSTKKQKDDRFSYNFYYDTNADKFIAFSKKKSPGIASVIFDKAPRPSGTSVKWKKKDKKEIVYDGKKIKKTRAVLPSSLAHLQERMDLFLDDNNLDITTSGLLIDGPNEVRPKVDIKVKTGKIKGNCYLCGELSHSLDDAKETVFPLITGASGVLSFNSQGSKPEKICWKCSFLGKFVPANGFYYIQGDSLFAFLPYSVSLEKMLDVWPKFNESKQEDPNLFRNFDLPLGAYFHHPFEVTFAFLYTLYRKVFKEQKAAEEDVNEVIDIEELFDVMASKAPIEFFVLHLESKGQTKMCKMAWPFQESVYFYRLLSKIESAGIQTKKFMHCLIDFTQDKNEAKTISRNRVCERILKKQSVLDLIEQHVFHADLKYITPLKDFVIIYEPIIRKEDGMSNEEQEVAVTLGRRLGSVVGKDGKKGDLFALRKTRTKVDFLEQLNRLQFKLGSFTVPPGVYEGKLTDKNFMEFKQFCMIAAVNSFNAVNSSAAKKGE